MTLRILDPGLFTLLVDFGRPRTRGLGVPIGGAFDRQALTLGNALLGNPADATALEVTLIGPTVRAECALACVVIGAPFPLTCGARGPTAGTTFTLEAGDVLRIGAVPTGARGYLCVRGGFGGPVILGSRSGLQALRAGDELPCMPGRVGGHSLGSLGEAESLPLRVLDGVQADWFAAAELYSQVFAVAPASNRMGLRLLGKPLRLPLRELVSEPVCPGAVQVTRDGQCIVLGVDGQTIGGYPKAAQVIAADIDRLGQLRPGARVSFARVSLDEAESAARERRVFLTNLLARLRVALSLWENTEEETATRSAVFRTE